ncbi:dermonecrotic toxin domain-containing protein [Pseudomonas sp. 18175]|uniref:dermonecrotic toxin domain-containing protein n=1 Tax=Pseudomonas sp. 18175 TaxID=3390056 RepID=UPI003D1F3647
MPVEVNTQAPTTTSPQSQLIEKHQALNKKINELLSHQVSFQRFIQTQLRRTFPQLKSIDPSAIQVNTYRNQPPAEPKLISTQTLSEALPSKIAQINRNAVTGQRNVEPHSSDTQTRFYINDTVGGAPKKLENQRSLLTLAHDIATRFPEALTSYWKRAPKGATKQPPRQEQLLDLHRQMLATEAALRFEDGTLSQAGKKLIDAAFQHPTLEAREREFPSGARPGVYPIRVDDNTPNGALLAGCFLISSSDGSTAGSPYKPADTRSIGLEDSFGPVVLYTPGEGFEEFDSPGEARNALAQRINNDEEKAAQLLKGLPLSVEHSRATQWGDDLLRGFAPVSGDVLAQTFTLLLQRQAQEVNETMQLAFAENATTSTPQLLLPETVAKINDGADLSPYFDGSNAMLARNEQLLNKLQPQWLKTLSHEQEAQYRALSEAEQKHYTRLHPLVEQVPPLLAFAKQVLSKALKTKLQGRYPKQEIDPDKLTVQIKIQHKGKPLGLNGAHFAPPKTEFFRASLTELALKNTAPWTAEPATTTWVATLTTGDGDVLTLDKPFLESLISQTDVGQQYLDLLKDKLNPNATSGEANVLHNAWKDHQRAKMAKEAFITSLDPDAYLNKQKFAEQWISATLGHDDATTWPKVNGASIVSHSVELDGKPVQGMLVIKPSNHPSLVLYSPDAPDGRPYREFVDQDQLNATLNKPEWQTYISQRVAPEDKYAKFDDLFVPGINSLLKKAAADYEAGVVLKPIKGGVSDHLYRQELGLLRSRASARMNTNASVSARSTHAKLMFATDMSLLLLSLIPVGAGVSAGYRLSKAALKTMRVPGRSLPKLITQPGKWAAAYNDFALAASGIPILKNAPLRPVLRFPASSATRQAIVPPRAPTVPVPGTSTGISSPLATHATTVPNRGNLAAYAVDHKWGASELLKSHGPKQVGDKWLIRYTDESNVSRTYQISPVLKFESGYVNIIDPSTGKRAITLQRLGSGEWGPTGLPGGTKLTNPVTAPSQTTSVLMQESQTLHTEHGILSTESLSDCSALAVLSDWNGKTYGTRTLMHLNGSNLSSNLNNRSGFEVIRELHESLKNGGKVILVGGDLSQSKTGLAVTLGQKNPNTGRQPLLDLINQKGVSFEVAGGTSVKVHPNGSFTVAEGGVGVLDEKAVKWIIDFSKD